MHENAKFAQHYGDCTAADTVLMERNGSCLVICDSLTGRRPRLDDGRVTLHNKSTMILSLLRLFVFDDFKTTLVGYYPSEKNYCLFYQSTKFQTDPIPSYFGPGNPPA